MRPARFLKSASVLLLLLPSRTPAQAMASMPMILEETEGSGTSWLPGSAPVHDHAYHLRAGAWNLMAHGAVFARYTAQNANNQDKWSPGASATAGKSSYPAAERGDDKTDFPDWAMVAADRAAFGADKLMLRAMISLDPWTEGRRGYPLLFQTGEGLIDRQHAHDLFMELSATYNHAFGERDHVYAYVGLPGEPALGPAAFMHRPSAWDDPDAPLAHHMEDATHITYGVATLGWIHGAVKAEGSVFRGREPDKDRWDIEPPGFDSYSLRAAWNPTGNLSLQASGGFLQDVEPDEPGVDLFRGTASIDHYLRIGEGADWASMGAFGFNRYTHGPHRGMTQAATLETDAGLKRAAVWARWESVERLGDELDIPGAANRFYWVHALSAGAGCALLRAAGMELAMGGQATFNAMDPDLEPLYGNRPVSWEIFLRLRPAAHRTGTGGHGMHMHGTMDMGDHGM